MEQCLIPVILVGVGNRGKWMTRVCTAANGYQPVALVDTNPAFLAEAREVTCLPAEACYSSLGAAIEAVRAEAVMLCTPTVTHRPLSEEALAAGLHVLVEKGMAPSWEEAQGLVRAVESSGRKLCVAQNYRYRGLGDVIRTALRDPVAPTYLGPVYWVDYVEHRVRPEPKTLSYPFASVWDMSCHHFDNLLDWLGPVGAITARAPAAPWSAYEHAANTMAMLRFANGTEVTYTHTHDAARGEHRIRLMGERGALFVDGEAVTFSPRPPHNFGWEEPVEVTVPEKDSELGVVTDFRNYLRSSVEPGISARQNLEVMAMCELTIRACQDQRPVLRGELDE